MHNLEAAGANSMAEENKAVSADSQQPANAATEETIVDDFVVVDNNYVEASLHPLSNLSEFTRVNPMTA